MLAEIKSLLGFAEKAQTKLDAIATSQGEVAELKVVNAKLQTTLTEVQGQVATITIEVDEARATITQQASEIVTLNASVDTEKRRANDVIASQGLPPSKLPVTDPTPPTGGATKSKTLTEQCLAANGKKNLN